MDALQAAVAALGMFYPGRNVKDMENNYWSAVRLIAKLPTIVAAWARLRRGDDTIGPRDELGFSENFFYMLTETTAHPLWVDIFDDCLILHAEHTMNASTFTGLVTASTLADPYTVVASSIGALKGPLHGGANEEGTYVLFRTVTDGDFSPRRRLNDLILEAVDAGIARAQQPGAAA